MTHGVADDTDGELRRIILKAARGSVLSAHATAGLAAGGKGERLKEGERILRAAEGLLRSAVAFLEAATTASKAPPPSVPVAQPAAGAGRRRRKAEARRRRRARAREEKEKKEENTMDVESSPTAQALAIVGAPAAREASAPPALSSRWTTVDAVGASPAMAALMDRDLPKWVDELRSLHTGTEEKLKELIAFCLPLGDPREWRREGVAACCEVFSPAEMAAVLALVSQSSG